MHDVTLESTDEIRESAFTRRGGAISDEDSIFGTTPHSLNTSISVPSTIMIDY